MHVNIKMIIAVSGTMGGLIRRETHESLEWNEIIVQPERVNKCSWEDIPATRLGHKACSLLEESEGIHLRPTYCTGVECYYGNLVLLVGTMIINLKAWRGGIGPIILAYICACKYS